MGDDVAADGLGRVLGERHAVGVGHDLVGNEDGDAEFLGETGQLPEELGHLHLPLGQLAPARIIGPEQGRGRIHHDEGVAILAEDGGRHLEELHLMLAVVGAGVRDVLEGGDGVHVEPLGDGLEPFGAEGPLGVDVHGLALGTAVGDGQLARDAEGVAELGLAGAEFTEDLGDGSGLDAALEELVKLNGPGGEGEHGLAILEGIGRRLEVRGDHGPNDFLDLEDLGLRDALDVGQLADGGVSDRLDGVVAGILELLEVVGVDAVLGEAVEGLEGHSDLLRFGLVEGWMEWGGDECM
mmetsp:Transcript_29088/g.84523  ORF Transcript_29088/g.84523 Transcript_29088/m.84523 type:complete len:296 (+) Transcript_29088:347-1234(+)